MKETHKIKPRVERLEKRATPRMIRGPGDGKEGGRNELVKGGK